jgi:hypothetical protein
MLQINTDTEVATGGVVYKVIQGGDFEEADLVEVYRSGDDDKKSVGAFQAHYIAFGYNLGEQSPESDD